MITREQASIGVILVVIVLLGWAHVANFISGEREVVYKPLDPAPVTEVMYDRSNPTQEMALNSLSQLISERFNDIENKYNRLEHQLQNQNTRPPIPPPPVPAPPAPSIMVEPKIKWIDSPVTQAWAWNERRQVWETVLPYKDSLRPSPTVIIGLRDDGTVVWKNVHIPSSR